MSLKNNPILHCPTCQHVLETMPKARRKCPACRNWIYLKRRPSEEQRRLVTAEEAKHIEEEWQKHYLTLSKEDRRQADQRWGELNRQSLEAASRGDWGTVSSSSFEMAFQLWKEGKSFFHVLQESRRSELESYKSTGVRKVRILTAGEGNACPICQSLDKKIFTIDQALNEMPIPVTACTTDLGEFGQQRGWCRCIYVCGDL